MMTNQEVVAIYEAMVGVTNEMVQAANDSDWDRLVLLEQQCAAYVRQLKENEPSPALMGTQRAQKAKAIRTMLDHDRKIRDLTMPWMARLAALINSTGTERRLARAYGAA